MIILGVWALGNEQVAKWSALLSAAHSVCSWHLGGLLQGKWIWERGAIGDIWEEWRQGKSVWDVLYERRSIFSNNNNSKLVGHNMQYLCTIWLEVHFCWRVVTVSQCLLLLFVYFDRNVSHLPICCINLYKWFCSSNFFFVLEMTNI